MEKYLCDIKPGERAVVKKVSGAPQLIQRLMAMGLVKGAEVDVIKLAPLYDPMEISVGGRALSLRKTDAKNITVR